MTLDWNMVQGSKAWHDARAENVGSSEVPVLFGCGEPYHPSPFELWAWKAGLGPEPARDDKPGSYIWFGKQLEPEIARMAALLNGWTIFPGPYATDDVTDGMAASLDYTIAAPGPAEIELGFSGPGNMEVKNVGVFQHRDKWVDDQPTDPVVLQLQDGMACSGYTWGAVVSMVGGNDIRTYRFPARPKIHGMIRERIAEFWTSIEEDRPPPIDGKSGTTRALRGMYPERGQHGRLNLANDSDAEVAAAALWLIAAHKEETDLRYEECQNVLRARLAGAVRAETEHYRIVTRGKRIVVYEKVPT